MNANILRHIRKIVVLVFGGTVLLIGIVLIFLPGPSFIVIPTGLAILAVEFSWARTLLKKAKHAQDTASKKISSVLPRNWRAKNPTEDQK